MTSDMRLRLLMGPLMLAVFGSSAQPASKLERKMDELVAKNYPYTHPALRAKLLRMRAVDQEVRDHSLAMPPEHLRAIGEEMERTGQRLTEELKEIVATYGWPTIDMAGLDGSRAAALVLIQSSDVDFQRTLLPRLERLAREDRILAADVALVVDKVLVADGKPQRYGTQFFVRNGKAVLQPVVDPAGLDRRRAKVLLPSMSEYRKRLAEMYQVPVE